MKECNCHEDLLAVASPEEKDKERKKKQTNSNKTTTKITKTTKIKQQHLPANTASYTGLTKS